MACAKSFFRGEMIGVTLLPVYLHRLPPALRHSVNALGHVSRLIGQGLPQSLLSRDQIR